MTERSSPVSGILTLDVGGWTLSVRVHDGGYEVSITEDGKCPASHYVRLDSEQADTLRDFMAETSTPAADAVAGDAKVTGARNQVEEAACLIWSELCPGMVMGDDDLPYYEAAAKAVLALRSDAAGGKEL